MSMFGFGACKAANCQPFSSADAAHDTVKIDHPPFAENNGEDKENRIPELEMKCKQAEEALPREAGNRAEAEAEAQRQFELEEQIKREEQEGQRRLVEEQENERQRVEAEEAAQAAQAEAAAHSLEQEALQRQEAERVAEAQRCAEEAKNAARILQQQQEERVQEQEVAKEKVDVFLKLHGYAGVNAKRSKMMKSKYPLDTAVKCKDAEMVQLLLAAGANRSLKSSAGKTPEQRARETNKNGSHDTVLAVFASNQ